MRRPKVGTVTMHQTQWLAWIKEIIRLAPSVGKMKWSLQITDQTQLLRRKCSIFIKLFSYLILETCMKAWCRVLGSHSKGKGNVIEVDSKKSVEGN